MSSIWMCSCKHRRLYVSNNNNLNLLSFSHYCWQKQPLSSILASITMWQGRKKRKHERKQAAERALCGVSSLWGFAHLCLWTLQTNWSWEGAGVWSATTCWWQKPNEETPLCLPILSQFLISPSSPRAPFLSHANRRCFIWLFFRTSVWTASK